MDNDIPRSDNTTVDPAVSPAQPIQSSAISVLPVPSVNHVNCLPMPGYPEWHTARILQHQLVLQNQLLYQLIKQIRQDGTVPLGGNVASLSNINDSQRKVDKGTPVVAVSACESTSATHTAIERSPSEPVEPANPPSSSRVTEAVGSRVPGDGQSSSDDGYLKRLPDRKCRIWCELCSCSFGVVKTLDHVAGRRHNRLKATMAAVKIMSIQLPRVEKAITLPEERHESVVVPAEMVHIDQNIQNGPPAVTDINVLPSDSQTNTEDAPSSSAVEGGLAGDSGQSPIGHNGVPLQTGVEDTDDSLQPASNESNPCQIERSQPPIHPPLSSAFTPIFSSSGSPEHMQDLDSINNSASGVSALSSASAVSFVTEEAIICNLTSPAISPNSHGIDTSHSVTVDHPASQLNITLTNALHPAVEMLPVVTDPDVVLAVSENNNPAMPSFPDESVQEPELAITEPLTISCKSKRERERKRKKSSAKKSRTDAGAKKQAVTRQPPVIIIQRHDCMKWRAEIEVENTKRHVVNTSFHVPLCMDCYVSDRRRRQREDRLDTDGSEEEEEESDGDDADVEMECRFEGANLRCVKYLPRHIDQNFNTEEEAAPMATIELLSESERSRSIASRESRLWWPNKAGLWLNKQRPTGVRSLRSITHPKVDIPLADAYYIMGYTASVVMHMLKEHEDVLDMYDNKDSAFKALPFGVRENCDACATSIFNAHYVCQRCGFSVCETCNDERRDLFEKPNKSQNESDLLWIMADDFFKGDGSIPRDGLQWHACPSRPDDPLPEARHQYIMESQADEYEFHHDLVPSRLIPTDACHAMMQCIEQLDYVEKQTITMDVDDEEAVPVVRCVYGGCNDGVMYLATSDADTPQMTSAFRSHWAKGLPVVVSGVTANLSQPSSDKWLPEYFAGNFGRDDVELIDCSNRPQLRVDGKKQLHFWNGFTDMNQRLQNEAGLPRLLKIKDWPNDARFQDALPTHYEELLTLLPFRTYSTSSGCMNLASYMPEHFNPPDLGPKLYIAYGMAGHSNFGTTNLHLDISDAVNILMHVSQPTGIGSDQVIADARDYLNQLALDEPTRARLDGGDIPGAVWQIYRPADCDAIRQFLKKYGERSKNTTMADDDKDEEEEDDADPLHTQMEFLTPDLRQRLDEETGVTGYNLVQFEGDAIFIPAGALHQVWNVYSCIKVASDFVSPEHVAECIKLTDQFRRLPLDYANRTDKLQVKSTLYHTVKTLLPVCLAAGSSVQL